MPLLGKSAKKALKPLLGMTKKERMERAREMGFDTDQAYYHGTASDFDEFSMPDDGRFSLHGRGVYFARDPSKVRFAEQDGGNVIPAHIRGKMGTEADRIDAERALGPQLAGMGHGPRSELINSEMRRRGFTGYHAGDQTIVFDPSNIRSVNAAFDPAKKDSPNLMAGFGGTFLGGGALFSPGEAEAGSTSSLGVAGQQSIERLLGGFNAPPLQEIKPVEHPLLGKAADKMHDYNRWVDTRPGLDWVLPEAPADLVDKWSYGQPTTWGDDIMAALGLL